MRVQCLDCEVIYNQDEQRCPQCHSYVYKFFDEDTDVASQTQAIPETKPIGNMTDEEFSAWQKLADAEISGTSDDPTIPPSPKSVTKYSNYQHSWDNSWDTKGAVGFTQRKLCTHKPREVINGKTWKVFAGAKFDCKRHIGKYPIILNLSGTSVMTQHSIPIPELQKWGTVNTQEIMLDWTDGSDINLPLAFWIDLRDYLADTKQNMLVFCLGGHGRTGTAIAAILIASGWKALDAIKWIRENYCQDAIETKVQEWYLDNLEEEHIELLADASQNAATSEKTKKNGKAKKTAEKTQ